MRMSTFARLTPGRRIAGAVSAAAVAVAGAGVAWLSGPVPGTASSPFAAGQAVTTRTGLAGPVASAAIARSQRDAHALGLPVAASVTAESVHDRFSGLDYTEVTASDPAVGPVAMTRHDKGGRLLAAVRFGWHVASGQSLASSSAAARAAALLRGVGLGQAGAARVTAAVDDGWSIAWPRLADGVPVLGDGVTVTLFADGTLHSIARSERPLAAAPGTVLAAAEARRLATAHLDAWLQPAVRADATISTLTLAWVAPNDAFEPAAPDAPASVLRLAWVAGVRADGALAEQLQAMELYLDAGTGLLLGGDLLR